MAGKTILSLDGGGVRGAATVRFLKRLDEDLQDNHSTTLRDCVDFYAGTSTGSILALALATTGHSLQALDDFYTDDEIEKVFDKQFFLSNLGGHSAPKYRAAGKTDSLRKYMGTKTIKNVPDNKHVLAVSYDLGARKPLIIKSTEPSHEKLHSADVADASSAAPTYFPTKKLEISEESVWCIDGGVIANNPTMCAVIEAVDVWKTTLNHLRVLSVGTGNLTRSIDGYDAKDWGTAEWLIGGEIISVLNDNERVTSYQAAHATKSGQYIRVNSDLSKEVIGKMQANYKAYPPLKDKAPSDDMDCIEPNNIKRLKALGDLWFEIYGDAAVSLLTNGTTGQTNASSQPVSLDRIDPDTGRPKPIE